MWQGLNKELMATWKSIRRKWKSIRRHWQLLRKAYKKLMEILGESLVIGILLLIVVWAFHINSHAKYEPLEKECEQLLEKYSYLGSYNLDSWEYDFVLSCQAVFSE